jgi:hypothetical protein
MSEVWIVLLDEKIVSVHETEDLAYIAGTDLLETKGLAEAEWERRHGETFGTGAIKLRRFDVEEDQ